MCSECSLAFEAKAAEEPVKEASRKQLQEDTESARAALKSRMDYMVQYLENDSLKLSDGILIKCLPTELRDGILKQVKATQAWTEHVHTTQDLQAKVNELDSFMVETLKSFGLI